MKVRILLFVFLLAFALGTFSVFAQESVTPALPTTTEDAQKITALRKTYLEQLEQYRIQEQKFTIAKGQYIQLQTLASQEEATKSMRELLILRAQALLTYSEILEALLQQSLGVPLENKNAELITLTLLKEDILLHKSSVESAFDRVQLDEESARFELKLAEIEQHSYYILNMIRVGAMRNASDKVNLLRDAVQTEISSKDLNPSKKAEKTRGFLEINRVIDTIQQQLTEIESEVHQRPGFGDSGSYSRVSTDLQGPYSNINQALSFIKEIRKP